LDVSTFTEDELRAAVQSDLSSPVSRYLLGSALTEQGQYALALPELQKAMELDFTYLAARLKFGQVQILLGQNEGAIKTTLNIFEDLSPGNVAAKLLRAVALRNLGRLEESRAEIQAVLKQQPGSADAAVDREVDRVAGRDLDSVDRAVARARFPAASRGRHFAASHFAHAPTFAASCRTVSASFRWSSSCAKSCGRT
jgi:tetratricopeptide (TPR) repeat protein